MNEEIYSVCFRKDIESALSSTKNPVLFFYES